MSNPVFITIDADKLKDATQSLAGIRNGLNKALVGAVNDTVKKQKTAMSREIRSRIFIKKRDIDPFLKTGRAKRRKLTGFIILSESVRIPLKRFGAKTKRKTRKLKGTGEKTKLPIGVTYKISRGKGRQFVPGAFGLEIPRLGNHVYRRVGASRAPITKLHGPSPWGVFVKAGLEETTRFVSSEMLHKNLIRRVKFLLLKEAGEI